MCRPGLIRRQDVPKFFLQLCRSVAPKNGDKQRSHQDMLITNIYIYIYANMSLMHFTNVLSHMITAN